MGFFSASSAKVAAATEKDLEFVHPAPSKLIFDSIAPGAKPHHLYNLNIGEKGRVTFTSPWAVFPLQISGAGVASETMLLEDTTSTNHNQVLAVLYREEKRRSTGFAWHIYCFHPYYAGQQPINDKTYEGKHLYEWALVKRHKENDVKGFSLTMQEQSSADLPKRTAAAAAAATTTTTAAAAAVGSYIAEPTKGDGSPLKVRHGQNICAVIGGKAKGKDIADGKCRNIKIVAGIDPTLFICYTAIVEEIIQEVKKKRKQLNDGRADVMETGLEIGLDRALDSLF